MHLWTMQTPDVDLRDTQYTVDHSKSPWVANFPKYQNLCRRLSEQLQLGTEQYIWCLTQDENTWNGREKWELDVPEEYVCFICSITWHWILTRSNGDNIICTPPEKVYDICWTLNINLCRNPNLDFSRDSFADQFHSIWRNKEFDELWKMLVVNVNESGYTCKSALVLLPVVDWITNEHKSG